MRSAASVCSDFVCLVRWQLFYVVRTHVYTTPRPQSALRVSLAVCPTHLVSRLHALSPPVPRVSLSLRFRVSLSPLSSPVSCLLLSLRFPVSLTSLSTRLKAISPPNSLSPCLPVSLFSSSAHSSLPSLHPARSAFSAHSLSLCLPVPLFSSSTHSSLQRTSNWSFVQRFVP
jgi:hypothetical protein